MWDDGAQDRSVVVRGYDKFFNVDELEQTKWEYMQQNMSGPFEVSVKENGCIIFVSTIDDMHLLVTSKHSIGDHRDDGSLVSHATKGREWLARHLRNANRTEQDLVQFLSTNRLTAVFELADDGFEEHVLEYPENARGLYVHGLNKNQLDFVTSPMEKVSQFAETFGFYQVKTHIMPTMTQVKQFLEQHNMFDGRFIEGFVIRCKHQSQDFFFKYKSDVPYLMFREWREVTRSLLIKDKAPANPSYPLTEKYIEWTRQKIKSHPHLFQYYLQQKGIIMVRNLFLMEMLSTNQLSNDMKWIAEQLSKTEAFQTSLKYAQMSSESNTRLIEDETWIQAIHDERKPTLIMPIATVGCGKTTLGLYLNQLFNIPHVQSDNIKKKRPGPIFVEHVMNEFMKGSWIVYADRNNHLLELRQNLVDAFKHVFPKGRIIALQWNIGFGSQKHFNYEKCLQRLRTRGMNHQSLTHDGKKATEGKDRLQKALGHFFYAFTPVNRAKKGDDQVDAIFEVNIDWSPLQVIPRLSQMIGCSSPTAQDIQQAQQNVSLYNAMDNQTPEDTVSYRYISVQVETEAFDDICKQVDILSQQNPLLERTWSVIKDRGRLSGHPHITLAVDPILALNDDRGLLNAQLYRVYAYRCSRLPLAQYKFKRVYVDERLVCVEVELDERFKCVNEKPHLTLGTVSEDARPYLSNVVMKSENVVCLPLPDRVVNCGKVVCL